MNEEERMQSSLLSAANQRLVLDNTRAAKGPTQQTHLDRQIPFQAGKKADPRTKFHNTRAEQIVVIN